MLAGSSDESSSSNPECVRQLKEVFSAPQKLSSQSLNSSTQELRTEELGVVPRLLEHQLMIAMFKYCTIIHDDIIRYLLRTI